MEQPIIKAFHYKLFNGRLSMKEGRIARDRSCHWREVKFIYGDGWCEWYKCNDEAGKMLNGGLWLPERDDEKARKLLLEYYEKTLADLQKKIASNEEKIRILKGA